VQENKHIGLYFGSFNPIHLGHLAVAEAAMVQIGLDELWFVVSPQNPAKVKSGELEDASHRLEMVKLSLADKPNMSACDAEFSMPLPSYTADTLALLRSQHPETKFSIVAGTDTQRKMGNYWRRREEILDMHNLIVYPREVSKKDSKWKLTDKAHAVSTYLQDVPQIDVSATMIRNNINSKVSNKDLIPDVVIDYIEENNLFQK
jgi:nicotinate-nucleotide adenylyltransferase